MPYQRGETQSELLYPDNTFLFSLLETLEAIIRESIIPAATSRREPLLKEREIFSLPLKSGGLGIDCPGNHHDDYELSKKLSEPLEDKDPLTAELWQKRNLDDLLNARKKIAEKISNIKSVLSTEQRHALERASQKGASAWLNVLPLKRYGFQLNKSEFRDNLSLIYKWNPKNAPFNCSCGEIFSVTHALDCPKGGYSIFNPPATSCPETIQDFYKYHEELKKLKYEQRIRDVENSTFNTLVFSSTEGAGPSAGKIMKRLAQKISEKKEEKYSDVMSFIRTKIGFALLKSSFLCIRGCRALKSTNTIENANFCILAESQID